MLRKIVNLFLLLNGLVFTNVGFGQSLTITPSACESYCFILTGKNPVIGSVNLGTVNINWGDGETDVHYIDLRSANYQLNACHSFPTSGTYTITFQIYSQGTLIDSIDTTLTLMGSSMQKTCISVISEGCNAFCVELEGEDSIITASDTIMIFANWGDGTRDTIMATSEQEGFYTSAICHNYAGDGQYTFSASIELNKQLWDTPSKNILVDCANQYQGTTITAYQAASYFCNGYCISLSGTSAQINDGDTITININWGDGQLQTQTTLAFMSLQNVGAYTLQNTCHFYTNNGIYPLAIYVYHKGNPIDTLKQKLLVNCKVTNITQENIPTIKIYPNPVKEALILESPSRDFTRADILDIQGRILMKKNLQGNYNTWDVSRLLSGTYILRIFYKDMSVKYIKLIKE